MKVIATHDGGSLMVGDIEEEPTDLASRATKVAYEAAEKFLTENGVTLDDCVVAVSISDEPEGEMNSALGCIGFNSGSDILAALAGLVVAFGEAMGLGGE